MSTYVVSMGVVAREVATFLFTGSGPYTCTAGSAPTHTVVVGDTVIDDLGNEYLVTGVTSTTVYTVTDYRGNGAPSDSPADSGTLGRAHPTLTEFEAEIGNYASSGDSVTCECYNDGTLDDRVAFDDATLGASGQLTITSPVGERHTGLAGTGFVIDPTSNGDVLQVSNITQPEINISFIEITGMQLAAAGFGSGISIRGSGARLIDSCLVHDFDVANAHYRGMAIERPTSIRNCVVYNIRDDGTQSDNSGIQLAVNADGSIIQNCTFRNCDIGISDLAGVTDVVLQNTGVFDCDDAVLNAGTFTGSGNNASDEASMPGSNNQVNLTSSDEFVDAASGVFLLKSTSNLKGAGTDLSGTVPRDIIGNIRNLNSDPDIGAFDWDTVSATIGSASGTGVTIDAVAGEAPEWTLTLSAAAPSDLIVGQKINDGTTDFLVRFVSGTTVVVRRVDFSTVVAPVTGAATTLRMYADLSTAEADTADVVEEGNEFEQLCMNDSAALDGAVTISDATQGASGQLTIIAPAGERHTGLAGSGLVLESTATNSSLIRLAGALPAVTFDHLEMTNWKGNVGPVAAIDWSNVNSGTRLARSLIIHDNLHTMTTIAYGFFCTVPVTIRNCAIYDIRDDGTQAGDAAVFLNANSDASIIQNCTIHNCDIGIADQVGAANIVLQNTGVFDCDDAVLNAGTFTGSGNNASDEASMPGSNNQTSLTTADQFKSLVDGGENYALLNTAALIDAGATLAAVTVDIIGTERPQRAGHDIGAFEAISAGVGSLVNSTRLATKVGGMLVG